MIFIVKKNSNGKWYKPQILLDRRFNYKIGLRHINFELTNANEMKNRQIICLQSSLVDMSTKNPIQSLEVFPYDSSVLIQDIRFQSIIYNTLQIRENLEDASFDLIDPFSEELIEFSSIFLVLEIIRQDSYGRIF